MEKTLIVFMVQLAFVVGVIVLQFFLSKRESRWAGLVLPIISFLIALLFPFMMAAPAEGITTGFAVQMCLVWVLTNIPTAVLLAVYFACRGKHRRNKQLDKMNIQDLD